MTQRHEPRGEASRPAFIDVRRQAGAVALGLRGQWTAENAARIEPELRALDSSGVARATLDLGRLEGLDTAGAWLIRRTARELGDRGVRVELVGASPVHSALLERLAQHEVTLPEPPPRENPFVSIVADLGEATVAILTDGRDLVNFLGLTVVATGRVLFRPARVRIASFVNHVQQTGLNAMPIVGLLSFLIGIVTAYQGADQLERFGAQIFTVNIVGIGVLREMGILITAIIVAGRSGSAFTAQIGTMNVNEEIDAMRTIGLDPVEVLVLPRVFALVFVMPLLTFFADIMGILGGAVMATVSLEMSLLDFARQLRTAVSVYSFWVGIVKAPVFAFVIALVGCFEGFMVARSAESVGRHTTKAVVEAVFLVIVLDALFSIFFSKINW